MVTAGGHATRGVTTRVRDITRFSVVFSTPSLPPTTTTENCSFVILLVGHRRRKTLTAPPPHLPPPHTHTRTHARALTPPSHTHTEYFWHVKPGPTFDVFHPASCVSVRLHAFRLRWFPAGWSSTGCQLWRVTCRQTMPASSSSRLQGVVLGVPQELPLYGRRTALFTLTTTFRWLISFSLFSRLVFDPGDLEQHAAR